MFRAPSGRRKGKREMDGINLVPILDAVFIFIFFLLMSASFINLFEISSDVPIVSNTPPKKNDKPLALTIVINKSAISVSTGVPSRVRRSFGRTSEGKYDLEGLKGYLITLKKRYLKENTAIFEPRINVEYGELVEIMDAVRSLRSTDEDIFYKDKDGVDRKVENLFDNIVFGNILS